MLRRCFRAVKRLLDIFRSLQCCGLRGLCFWVCIDFIAAFFYNVYTAFIQHVQRGDTMKKVIGGKGWTIAGICFAILLLIGLIVYSAQSYLKLDTTISRSVFLEGEYSVDGGEWKPTNGYDPINERFHKIVFKGKMSDFVDLQSENITISSQNVWYTLKTAQGEPVFELTYVGKDELRQLYLSSGADPNDPMFQPENFDLVYYEGYASKVSFPDTPGFKTATAYAVTLNGDGKLADKDLVLEVVNPSVRAAVFACVLFRYLPFPDRGLYFGQGQLPVLFLRRALSFLGTVYDGAARRRLYQHVDNRPRGLHDYSDIAAVLPFHHHHVLFKIQPHGQRYARRS